MKKERNLNVAQALLIGIICNAIDNDETAVKINTWLRKHRVLAAALWNIFMLIAAPFAFVIGLICPADDVLDNANVIIESAVLTNEACEVEEP